ncbi:hypothetical protein QCA50_019183 [Cerrena zonata]|uniref:Uncharacterized protein n=1 Tax=Cerrena zonata TaxID=2478898 RepID=A0AAW0FBV6_9APHY
MILTQYIDVKSNKHDLQSQLGASRVLHPRLRIDRTHLQPDGQRLLHNDAGTSTLCFYISTQEASCLPGSPQVIKIHIDLDRRPAYRDSPPTVVYKGRGILVLDQYQNQ